MAQTKKKLKYLSLRKNNIWFYQRAVPKSLAGHFPSTNLTKSLRTSEAKVAIKRQDELDQQITKMLSLSPHDVYTSTLKHFNETLTDSAGQGWNISLTSVHPGQAETPPAPIVLIAFHLCLIHHSLVPSR